MEAFAESAGRAFRRARILSHDEHERHHTQPRSQHTDRSPQVVVGLLIMLLGFGFLFDRMDVWHVHLSAHFWPLFPLFFGIARVLDGPR